MNSLQLVKNSRKSLCTPHLKTKTTHHDVKNFLLLCFVIFDRDPIMENHYEYVPTSSVRTQHPQRLCTLGPCPQLKHRQERFPSRLPRVARARECVREVFERVYKRQWTTLTSQLRHARGPRALRISLTTSSMRTSTKEVSRSSNLTANERTSAFSPTASSVTLVAKGSHKPLLLLPASRYLFSPQTDSSHELSHPF